MLKAFAVSALASVALLSALSAKADTKPDPCASQACRKGGYNVALRVDAKKYATVPVSHSPYILPNGSIMIFPGETIAVQFTLDGDKLTAPKFYKAYAPRLPAQVTSGGKMSDPDTAGLGKDDAGSLPPNTVLLSYGQFKGQAGMVLEVEHNMPRTVKLDALMAVIQQGAYVQKPAATCPVKAKLLAFETWQQPLGPMVLANTRFAADGDTTCR
ncbi:MAG TPA: hypothetical protein VG839_02870 [Asticcacaulis sp.]|nr:hypothetical protein [Asticcacaulis sp.]